MGYRLGTAGYREPSLVTNSDANYSWVYTAGNNYDATNYNQLSDLGIDSPESMGQYLNNQYTQMAESIIKYGGYYVGRYETSLYTEDGTNSTNGLIAKSTKDVMPMSRINWYRAYLVQDNNYKHNLYYGSNSIGSMMVTGSQWDTMLNFILTGSDKEKLKVSGNKTGTTCQTGIYGDDIMNNIFDLNSNQREWTQMAINANSRILRGGYYTNDTTFATRDNSYDPTKEEIPFFGSRMALYIK